MRFDFQYNDHTGQIEKTGHYSQCPEREATREEALLWGRVQELERVFNDRCPAEVKTLLTKIEETPEDAARVELNPLDFAQIRKFAPHRVEMSVDPKLNCSQLVGHMPIMRDGYGSVVWIGVDRDVPQGDVRVVAYASV